jgi:flagellin-like hook-associated protein FlgL
MLAAINSQAADQLADQGMAPSLFTASLSTDGNGIVLAQDNTASGMSDPIAIEPRNNSQAASDLGLLRGERSDDGSSIVGDDRAKIRPHNVFSWLIDLRDSLTGNSTSGIGIAGENIGNAVDTLAETRALVGGYANRVGRETDALEDRNVLDASLLSQLQDADFAQAATQLSLLQTQLQAALQTTATISSLSLLNYL